MKLSRVILLLTYMTSCASSHNSDNEINILNDSEVQDSMSTTQETNAPESATNYKAVSSGNESQKPTWRWTMNDPKILAEHYYELGKRQVDNSESFSGIRSLSLAILQNLNMTAAYCALADQYDKLGFDRELEAVMQRAEKSNLKADCLNVNNAKLNIRKGKLHLAESALDPLIDRENIGSESLSVLIDLRLAQGRKAAAAQQLEKLVLKDDLALNTIRSGFYLSLSLGKITLARHFLGRLEATGSTHDFTEEKNLLITKETGRDALSN